MTSAEHDGRPGRILLVEDDAVAAHFAMHVLGRQGGFEVVHTPDPAVALQRVSSEAWDLVLTDAELPGMTGLELLEAVRRLSPGLPIAVITAHEPGETTVQALRKRADEFLQKPVRPDRLLPPLSRWWRRGARRGWLPGRPYSPSARTRVTSRRARPEPCSLIAASGIRSRS